MKTDSTPNLRDVEICHLKMSGRVFGRLAEDGIKTLGQLADKSPRDLFRISGFGASSLREVRAVLKACGLSLTDDGSMLESPVADKMSRLKRSYSSLRPEQQAEFLEWATGK